MQTLMGQEQTLGKAYAIMAVMMHGPDLPTEISLHAERQRIFNAAAPYAMSSSDIATVLAHPDDGERRIYFHNLLTTSCKPLCAVLHNEARQFFQTCVFASPRHNPEYKLHLGLKDTASVFDQYVVRFHYFMNSDSVEPFPLRGRFKKTINIFCPPPPMRGGGQGECGVDKIRSALGIEYSKALHYAIGHLRRADGGLRPKKDGEPGCSMDLLAGGDNHRC